MWSGHVCVALTKSTKILTAVEHGLSTSLTRLRTLRTNATMTVTMLHERAHTIHGPRSDWRKERVIAGSCASTNALSDLATPTLVLLVPPVFVSRFMAMSSLLCLLTASTFGQHPGHHSAFVAARNPPETRCFRCGGTSDGERTHLTFHRRRRGPRFSQGKTAFPEELSGT